jgi:hypothetical protein
MKRLDDNIVILDGHGNLIDENYCPSDRSQVHIHD